MISFKKFLMETKRTEAEQKAFSLGFEHGFFIGNSTQIIEMIHTT